MASTIRDVARLADVDTATIGRVISSSPHVDARTTANMHGAANARTIGVPFVGLVQLEIDQ